MRQILSLYNRQPFTTSIFLIVAACVYSQHTFGQFTDSFADGNYTANPTWTGTDAKFTVYNQQLRLQAPAVNGNAYLTTPSRAIDNITWEFSLNLQFNPSGDNYVRVYLATDQADLTGELNGYFVMIGNTADEISLYRQRGAQRTEVIDGADGRVNLSTVSVRVKITRDGGGQWQLFSDVGQTGAYAAEGNVVDNTFTTSAYFGLLCVYTATRADKIWFDDFIVRETTVADTQKPALKTIRVVAARELALEFSEPLNAASVMRGVYTVDRGVDEPKAVELLADQRTVRLVFAADFTKNVSCSLSIAGVADLAGNIMEPAATGFMYVVPMVASPKDVIITELLPDPSPRTGLPEEEFAEIYNRSGEAVNLQGWTLSDGVSTAKFPLAILAPGEYLILTASANAVVYGAFSKTVALPNFPTLNNAGDKLVLKDSSDVTIDSLNYTSAWYHNEDKKEGGWSLELIDPDNICAASGNWTASEDKRGGTPGKQNSVFANKPDVMGPMVRSAMAVAENKVRVVFDEKLDRIAPAPGSFKFDPAADVQAVQFTDGSRSAVDVKLTSPLLRATSYKLVVNRVYDCTGNAIQPDHASAVFGLPESVDSADVVINEILFNPRPTGVDFVEVCNRSDKFLNIKGWRMTRADEEARVITTENVLLAPGGYLLLSEDGSLVKNEYPLSHEENFLDVKDVPSMNDDEGSIALLDSLGSVIDAMTYKDDLHSPFIDDEEGVSLERLSWERPTLSTENWHSAATQVGYATPGYKNSNAVGMTPSTQSVTVEPEAFKPETGQPSFTRISYQFERGGLVANVNIIDPQGRVVRSVAANEILSASGFYQWNGEMDNGRKVRIGYYMVWFEVFDEDGNVRVFKKAVAVIGDF